MIGHGSAAGDAPPRSAALPPDFSLYSRAGADEVDRILAAANIAASVEPVPATIEERMLLLARHG